MPVAWLRWFFRSCGSIRGVNILGPNRCAIFMNLLPVLTAAAAITLLGEPVRSYHVIGAAVALAGVACAEIFRRPLRGAPPAIPDILE
jgi:drug/metabolite transporter (DMT)-like permease